MATKYEFPVLRSVQECSTEVIHVASQLYRLIGWVAKTGGITVVRKRYGGGRQYYRGAMQLGRIGTVLRGDETS